MDERALRTEELDGVSGGAGGRDFPALAESFVRANRCALCPSGRHKLRHGMCMEEYGRLLLEWSGGGPVDMRCARRP